TAPCASMARKPSTSSGATVLPTAVSAKAGERWLASEKVTTSAPPLLRKSRRVGLSWSSMSASRSDVGRGALHRAQDAHMGPAATEIVGERLLDLVLARILRLGEKGGRLHDHAVDAIAALHRLLVDEGLLHG